VLPLNDDFSSYYSEVGLVAGQALTLVVSALAA
jgi:hypothetical protein